MTLIFNMTSGGQAAKKYARFIYFVFFDFPANFPSFLSLSLSLRIFLCIAPLSDNFVLTMLVQ